MDFWLQGISGLLPIKKNTNYAWHGFLDSGDPDFPLLPGSWAPEKPSIKRLSLIHISEPTRH
eukprot:7837778-Karenia_brevis.AAC.1